VLLLEARFIKYKIVLLESCYYYNFLGKFFKKILSDSFLERIKINYNNMATFKELGLKAELTKSLDDLGFKEPSPIQEKAIPFILGSRKDLIALAQTGTGKTAAFSLPILNQIEEGEKVLQVIVICPTRELCLQISEDIKKFTKYLTDISVTAVYGGERIDFQIKSLKRGTNIVVGTPGRLNDLIRRKVLKLDSIKWLVLDEADEMLDMGFKDDLDLILKETPKEKQSLLFSATMSKSVHAIASKYMGEAHEISVGERNIGAEKVDHEYYVVQERDRFEALKRVLDNLPQVYGILFCRTRRETQDVAEKLKQAKYNAEAIHGEVSQNMRTKIMNRFKQKQIKLLVATDVAARGIDVSDLSHVINYNLPDHKEVYTHRSGRTGRAQKSGISISIISPKESRRIRELENIIGKKFELRKIPTEQEIFKKQVDSFIKEVEEVNIENIGNDDHFSEIVDKLKKIKKEDLIKHFIAHKFRYFLNSQKSNFDLNAEAKVFKETKDDKNNVNLKINFGKNYGFYVKSLLSLINSNRNLKGIDIGRINLMNEYSIFSVDKICADEVIEVLQGTNFRGKTISISKSFENINYRQGNRKNRSNRGYRRSSGFKSKRRYSGSSKF